MTLARLFLFAFLITLAFFLLGRAIGAETDPAIPACEQSIADGYYTTELYNQCLDDYHGRYTP